MKDPLPNRDMQFKTALAKRMHDLEKQGRPTEAAWLLYEAIVRGTLPPGVVLDNYDEHGFQLLREAFFAGALYMHGKIAKIIDEATEDDTDKAWRQIHEIKQELNEFDDVLRLKYGNAVGSA